MTSGMTDAMTYADAALYLAANYPVALPDADRVMQAARERGIPPQRVLDRYEEVVAACAICRRAAFAQVRQELATGLLT